MFISNSDPSSLRVRTIDILRALTMFFMIFVNDLWTLTGVPQWLKHTLADEDGMGFSDVIFPLFLFIVGLSIPLAIENRLKHNDSHVDILGHISLRTLALLVMGFYMVNGEVFNQEAAGMNKSIWQILMATAIFLVWMDYKRLPQWPKGMAYGLRALGVLILLYLAWVYRGGPSDNISSMQPRWWGILGLIGWAYLLNSLIYLFARKHVAFMMLSFSLLLFLNVQEKGFFEFLPGFRLVVSASNHALVMGGLLCTVFYMRFNEKGNKINQFLTLVAIAGVAFISYGFLIRPIFPISKIYATPSWVGICMGIGFLTYALLYIIVDKQGYSNWARLIKPAGTSTLTCYLIPYFVYPLIKLLSFEWPHLLTDGLVGIVKSLLFSLAIISFVGLLEKRDIRLKI